MDLDALERNLAERAVKFSKETSSPEPLTGNLAKRSGRIAGLSASPHLTERERSELTMEYWRGMDAWLRQVEASRPWWEKIADKILPQKPFDPNKYDSSYNSPDMSGGRS